MAELNSQNVEAGTAAVKNLTSQVAALIPLLGGFRQNGRPVDDVQDIATTISNARDDWRSLKYAESRLKKAKKVLASRDLPELKAAEADVARMSKELDTKATYQQLTSIGKEVPQALVDQAYAIIFRANGNLDAVRELSADAKTFLLNKEADQLKKDLARCQTKRISESDAFAKIAALIHQLYGGLDEVYVVDGSDRDIEPDAQYGSNSGSSGSDGAAFNIDRSLSKLRRLGRSAHLLAAAERRIERRDATIQELDESNEKLKAAKKDLKAANKALEVSNKEIIAANEGLADENEELTAANRNLTDANDKFAATNKELNAISKSLKDANNKLAAAIKEFATANSEFAAAHKDLTGANDKLVATNKVLKGVNNKVTAANSDLTDANNKLAATNKDLTDTNDKVTAANRDLTDANDKLVATGKSLIDANNKLTATNKGLTDANDKVTATNSDLTDANDKLAATNKVLKGTNDKVTAANRDLTDANDKLAATGKSLTDANKKLTATNNSMTVANDKVTAANKKLSTTNNVSTAANNKLAATNKSLTDANNKLTAANKDLMDVKSYRIGKVTNSLELSNLLLSLTKDGMSSAIYLHVKIGAFSDLVYRELVEHYVSARRISAPVEFLVTPLKTWKFSLRDIGPIARIDIDPSHNRIILHALYVLISRGDATFNTFSLLSQFMDRMSAASKPDPIAAYISIRCLELFIKRSMPEFSVPSVFLLAALWYLALVIDNKYTNLLESMGTSLETLSQQIEACLTPQVPSFILEVLSVPLTMPSVGTNSHLRVDGLDLFHVPGVDWLLLVDSAAMRFELCAIGVIARSRPSPTDIAYIVAGSGSTPLKLPSYLISDEDWWYEVLPISMLDIELQCEVLRNRLDNE